MRISILAAGVAVLASACGGGGELTSPTVSVTSNLKTTIPAPNYAAQSQNSIMFTELNAIRMAGGFGLLPQNVLLDQAATNHAAYVNLNYLDANGIEISTIGEVQPNGLLKGHTESPAGKGFTGVTPADRANAVGYLGKAVDEDKSGYYAMYPTSKSETEVNKLAAIYCIESLFGSNHHRASLLETKHAEIGVGSSASVAYAYGPISEGRTLRLMGCVLNPSLGLDASNRGVTPNQWTGVYPLDNATGVSPSGLVSKLEGMAASIHFDSKSTLSLSSFTLKNLSDGAMVVGTVDTTIRKYQAYFTPSAKLAPLTQYEANFQGSELTSAQGHQSRNVSKVWRFTTR